jgi:VanZ family protein
VRVSSAGARPRTVLRLVVVCALVLVTVFGQLPGGSVFWATLQNFAHYPAFISISLVLVSLWPSGSPQWLAFAVTLGACLLLGVGIEIAQSLFGGDVSVQDVLTDMAGSVTGLSAYALRQPPRRLAIAALGTTAFLITLAPVVWMMAAVTHRSLVFPTLVSGGSALDLYFLATDGRLNIEPLPDSLARKHGERGIRADLSPDSAGLFLTEPARDWSGYDALVLDLANPTDSAETLRLRVHDRQHNQQVEDRFNQSLVLPADERLTFRIELTAIRSAPSGRLMQLDEIAGLALFDPHPQAGTSFYVNRIRLERAHAN